MKCQGIKTRLPPLDRLFEENLSSRSATSNKERVVDMTIVVCQRFYTVAWYVNGNTLNMLTLAQYIIVWV